MKNNVKPGLLESGKISDVKSWEEKRAKIIEGLYSMIGRPPVDRNTRDIKTIFEEKLEAYTRRKISYVVGEDEVIKAYLLIPNNLKGKSAAVVALHQTTGDGKDEPAGISGSRELAYGDGLARRGFVVIIPDYLTAGERIFPGLDAFETAPFYEKYPEWSMVGKNIDDTMAAVDVLYTLGFVDKDRIGAIGHSLGGHNTFFAMAVDSRIKAGVSNCGLTVFSKIEQKYQLEWARDHFYIYMPALRAYFLDGKAPPFDMDGVIAAIAPRPFMNISAYNDRCFGDVSFLAETGAAIYQVYKLYGGGDSFANLMHGNDHSFPKYARDAAYDWLEKFLTNEK
jgi:dienelactone hydrolase